MAQESSLFSTDGGSILDKIEPLMKYFDAVLNNREFPNSKEMESRVDHDILGVAIGLYEACLKHCSSMTLPKVSDLEPGLTKKIDTLIASRGEDFAIHLVAATNCFFEHSLAKEQPSNVTFKPLAEQASKKLSPVKSC
jgi:hypothetical protein